MGSAKVRRNDPCPCGSGRKYKHCHGDPARPAPAPAIPTDPMSRLEREVPLLGATREEIRALFGESRDRAGRCRADFDALEWHCLFVGYPRSGHSLFAAHLDAHPDMVISHELDVLKFLGSGFTREQIDYLLIENARRHAALGRRWGPYSYEVPGQWQGRFSALKVLGDKKAGLTSLAIGRDHRALDTLWTVYSGRVKLLHVVRNPFDVIATNVRKSSMSLDQCVDLFFFLCGANEWIGAQVGDAHLITVRHEDTVRDARGNLSRVCAFLDRAASTDYLNACAATVFESAKTSRQELEWPPEIVARVERQIERFDFLTGYCFAEPGAPGS